MATIIAIPSNLPGGLEAGLGMHFGHCEVYTLVTFDGDTVTEVKTVEPIPHQHGGCMAPVEYLAGHGVQKIIAGGMGMRPLMGFQQKGIEALFAGHYTTVAQAVDAYIKGKLLPFSTENTCGGH